MEDLCKFYESRKDLLLSPQGSYSSPRQTHSSITDASDELSIDQPGFGIALKYEASTAFWISRFYGVSIL